MSCPHSVSRCRGSARCVEDVAAGFSLRIGEIAELDTEGRVVALKVTRVRGEAVCRSGVRGGMPGGPGSVLRGFVLPIVQQNDDIECGKRQRGWDYRAHWALGLDIEIVSGKVVVKNRWPERLTRGSGGG